VTWANASRLAKVAAEFLAELAGHDLALLRGRCEPSRDEWKRGGGGDQQERNDDRRSSASDANMRIASSDVRDARRDECMRGAPAVCEPKTRSIPTPKTLVPRAVPRDVWGTKEREKYLISW